MSYEMSSSGSSEMMEMDMRSNYSASEDADDDDRESHVEKLLTEKLLQGMVLQQKMCPNCEGVPLVKAMVDVPQPDDIDDTNLSTPVEPVKGVPFCVSCSSHVIHDEEELNILSKYDSIDRLKKRGSILFTMQIGQDDEAPSAASTDEESASAGSAGSTSHTTGRHSSVATPSTRGGGSSARPTSASVASYSTGRPESALSAVTPSTRAASSHASIPAETASYSTGRPESALSAVTPSSRAASSHASIPAETASYSTGRPVSALSQHDEEEEFEEEGIERPLTEDGPQVLAVPSEESEEGSGVELIQTTDVTGDMLDPSEDLIAEDFGFDYDNRRDIATKVLGQKMIKGWELRETQCEKCDMPMMHNPNTGETECVVCEALIKRATKRQKERLRKVQEAREQAFAKAQLEEKMRLEKIRVQKAMEEAEKDRQEQLQARLEAERRQVEELRQWENKRLAEELKIAKMSLEEAEKQRMEEKVRIEENTKKQVLKEQEQAILEKELRLTRESREREEERNRRESELTNARNQESRRMLDELQLAKEEAERERKARIQEKKAAEKLNEELRFVKEKGDVERKRMEEELHKANETISSEKKNFESEMERRKVELETAEGKAKEMEEMLTRERGEFQEEARNAEEMRQRAEHQVTAALEARREAELKAIAAKKAIGKAEREKRRVQEQSELAALAREAEEARNLAETKAAAAQQILLDAEKRAKEASQHQYTAEERLDKESQMIEERLQRERYRLRKEQEHDFDAMRMNEERYSSMHRDYDDPPHYSNVNHTLSSHSSGDDWELRRERSRQIISNRILGGWELLSEYCNGKECNYSPLLARGDIVQCVVCDGSGNGEDGAYANMHFDTNVNRNVNDMGAENEDDLENDDDISISSRQSITIEIPENFDPTDANAMAQLVTNAARSVASMGSRQGRRRSTSRGHSPSPRSRRSPSPSYNSMSRRQHTPNRSSSRGPVRRTPPSGRSGVKRPENHLPFLPPRPNKPTPESRNPGGMYRGGAPGSPSSQSPGFRRSMVIAHDHDDDTSQITDDDQSIRSTASHTLNAILNKIEDCKAQLHDPRQSAAKKEESARMIEKLASAAVAVQRLESPP